MVVVDSCAESLLARFADYRSPVNDKWIDRANT
jgi:hypothetical protein